MDETKRSKQEALDKRYIRMASIWAETHTVNVVRWVHSS